MSDFQRITDELAALLTRKQADYGTKNIEAFGEFGILVRLSDKLARMQNLLTSGQTPSNESIEDTWRDIAGYGILGLMVHRGEIDSQFDITDIAYAIVANRGEQ